MQEPEAAQEAAEAEYLRSLAGRLEGAGLSERDDGPEGYRTRVFHRRGVSLKKLGYVDTFVVVAEFDSLTPERAEEFSKAAFKYGLANKSWFPRILGTALVVYPVIVGEEFDRSVLDWINSYRNNHLSSYEFPVLVDPTHRRTFYNDKRSIMGWLHYGSFQRFADRRIGPAGEPVEPSPAGDAAEPGGDARGQGVEVNYCPSCGSEISHDAAFCGSCGTEL
ncbi:zinc ribbon domain-containing protein [Halostella salina]|uniref:zinc ribbon domain-containing protein n=1 Tax=Halostella salina TaxID=1547897 RepID=UPI0013CE6CFE|nr:zinc ribbon domain-containing protein [Halostella salina]